MDYALPWDRTTLVWTLATAGVLLTLTAVSAFWWRSALRNEAPIWPPLLAGTICLGSLIAMASVAPLGVSIEGSRMRIRRPVGSAVYDLSQVTSVHVVPFEEVFSGWTIRIFGVGGPFGLIGRFRSPSLGAFRAAVTHRGTLVLLRFHEGLPLALSPVSAQALAESVRRANASDSGKR